MTTQHRDAMKLATPPMASHVLQANRQLLAKGLTGKMQWKTLIEKAHANWNLISIAELAAVDGDIHTLAGLVQLRHRVSRAEADQQVNAFFTAHLPTSNATGYAN